MVSEVDLKALKFEITHQLQERGGQLRFVPCGDGRIDPKPAVYLWVSSSGPGEYVVHYVGKARGMRARLTDHERGFRHSKTGKRNAEKLRGLLDNGGDVLVFTRDPARVCVLDELTSLWSAEEEALLRKWEPEFNRANPQSLEATAVATHCLQVDSALS